MSATSHRPLALGAAVALLVAAGLAIAYAPMPPPASIEPGTEQTEAERAPSSLPERDTFIAMMRDFAGFSDWSRHAVQGAMLPVGVQDGPTYIYANVAPPDASRWPVGTILVKVIESGAQPEQWTIHAMVKRGVPFNGDGAVGWEFFELSLPNGLDEPPLILWRGTGPPSGHGYASATVDAGPEGIPLVCNDCHSAAWQSDGVLTPALALR